MKALQFIPVLLLIVFLTSCAGSKNVHTVQQSSDSSHRATLDSFNRVLNDREEKHQKEIELIQTTGIRFSAPCPPELDYDSLRYKLDSAGRVQLDVMLAELNRKDREVSALKNKIRMNADGTFEAEGRIESVNFSLQKSEKEKQELKSKTDSLTHKISTLEDQLVKSSKQKDKQVKRWPLIAYILFFLLAFILGCVFWHNRKRVFNRFNLFTSKNNNMKLLLFVLTCLLVMSCDSHSNPSDNISFGQAFSYCSTLTGYWVWVIIAVAAAIGIGIYLYKNYQKTQEWSGGKSAILMVCLALILCSILIPPANVAANTTVEQASRGVYIR